MQAAIHYRVEIADARSHHFEVTLTIAAPQAQQIVSLPAWIPGSYLIREFVRHLSGLRAQQGGASCELVQLDKATWRIDCQADTPVHLRYRVYAFDNGVRGAWLDESRVFFNGTSLCLRVHNAESQRHRLTLAGLPAGWRVATAMPQIAEHEFEAADYHELVDHPFELGTFWQGRFEAGGVEHRIVIAGALPSLDGDRLLADTQRICAAQIAFWGVTPFPAYAFLLNAVDDGYGGLEHRASTALIAARRDLPRLGQPELNEGYGKLLGLISHEYFHSWNVKRLRPAEFARYEYTQENYTELLWFFEGFTSYYDDLMLVRAGLIDEARYLKLLSATVSGVLATPGRKVQSVAKASFDAWVKYYRQDENTPNSTISYYGKGALVALALDLSLRELNSSLDAVMRALWQRCDAGPMSEADVLAVVTEYGNADVAASLSQWVHGTDDLPLQPLLESHGLQWRSDKATLAQRLGLKLSESALTGVQVKQVLAGSAAQAAGLNAGDEILGCNQWRIRRIDDALLTLGAGETALRLLVSRDQRLRELQLELPAVDASMAPVILGAQDAAADPRAQSLRRFMAAGRLKTRSRWLLAALVLPVLLLHLGLGHVVQALSPGLIDAPAMPPRLSVSFVREMKAAAPPRRHAAAADRAKALPRLHADTGGEAMAAADPLHALSPLVIDAPPELPKLALEASQDNSSTEPGPEWPLSTQLAYTLVGNFRGKVHGDAQVEWLRQGARYQVRIEVSVGPSLAPFMTRRLSSEGALMPRGIAPQRFDEDTRILFSHSRKAMHFKGARVLLADGREEAAPVGVQDSASQFVQLTWLFLTGREVPAPGRIVELPLALPKRQYERWGYRVVGEDLLQTPIGPIAAWHLVPTRETGGGDLMAEVWLAPSLQFMPVRIVIREDGDTFVDLLLRRAPLQEAAAATVQPSTTEKTP